MYVCIEGMILNRGAREGLPEKVTFEQTSKECKGLWGESILRRGSNWRKGPEAGDCLTCQRTAVWLRQTESSRRRDQEGGGGGCTDP